MKRIFVSLPNGVWNILKKDFKKKMGESESEIVRNIIISFLAQKGYFFNKNWDEVSVDNLRSEFVVTKKLIDSLVEVLEEKGNITFDEVDRRMKKKIAEIK